jgi:hypothetical protein
MTVFLNIGIPFIVVDEYVAGLSARTMPKGKGSWGSNLGTVRYIVERAAHHFDAHIKGCAQSWGIGLLKSRLSSRATMIPALGKPGYEGQDPERHRSTHA